MKCLIHTVTKDPGKEIKITEVNWKTVSKYASEWLNLDGEQHEIAVKYKDVFQGSFENASQLYCFHRKCYHRFTDKVQVERAVKRKSKQDPVLQPSEDPSTPSPKKRLRSHRPTPLSRSAGGPVLPQVCLICKKVEAYIKVSGRRVRDKLMKTQTVDGAGLRKAAEMKMDESILRHIRDRDCFAIEARYHLGCHKKYTQCLYKKQPSETELDQDKHQQSFDMFCETVIRPRILIGGEILRMTKLLDLYIQTVKKVEDLDASAYRSAKLKKRLRSKFPQLMFYHPADKSKSEIVFVEDVRHLEKIQSSTSETAGESSESNGSTGSEILPRPFSENVLHTLFTAALRLRNDLSETTGYQGDYPPLSGSFNFDACKSLIPISLYNVFAWMIGASEDPIIDQYVSVDEPTNVKLLSILQDVIFLQSKGRKQTMKSLCLGLTVRHLSGSKQIVDILNGFGHCASYSTIVRYDTSLAQLQIIKGPVFVPDSFTEKLNTVLVWDNIDFSEQTLSGHGTTHHTNGIALQCSSVPALITEVSTRSSLPKRPKQLPKLTTALQVYQPKKRIGPPLVIINEDLLCKNSYKTVFYNQHLRDMCFVITRFFGSESNSLPGWTGFNTLLSSSEQIVKTNIAYMPVIEASPTEMNTIQTILSRSLEMADKLNLKTITLVFDLTIYAKAQEVRWNDDNFLSRIIVRLGEFHTCMSFLSIIGKRFEDAGLKNVLIEAEIVAGGSISAVMEGKQYNRCMYAHKLMFEALHRLKFKAFIETLTEDNQQKLNRFLGHMVSTFPTNTYLDLMNSDEFLEILTLYEKFNTEKCAESKTFALWNSYLEMVELLLSFIRSTRDSDWNLHLASIRSMLPWYFAYDKTHYSRYLPIYWLEMDQLPSTHPEAYDELTKPGQWTVQRQTNYGFSAVACDQTIEQTINRESKTSGGITGFTLNRNAVRRWILSQSQRTAIHHQCEILAGIVSYDRPRKDLDKSHTKKGEDSINRIMGCLDEMINPFIFGEDGLVSISSGVIAQDDVSSDLLSAYEKGESALNDFLKERLTSDKKKFHDPLKQMKLKTFTSQQKMKRATKSGKEVVLQNDRKLFSRLLIISQQRSVDLREVLQYSLGPVSYPLSSSNGSISKTNKAALLHVIESISQNHTEENFPQNSALIYDGMAMVQAMPKDLPATFGEVADLLLSQILVQANQNAVERVDFVTDQYPAISIKNLERNRRAARGVQKRQIYSKEQKIPQQWSNFLADSSNKESFIQFLFSTWRNISPELLGNLCLYFAHGNDCHKIQVLNSVTTCELVDELCSNHEEADTRMILHAKHASDMNYSKIVIKSPDTDVVVILLSFVEEILSDIYFFTGTKTRSRIINISKIFSALGRQVSLALVGLHTFTGCDSTSCFVGKGKKKAFNMLQSSVQYQLAFMKLGSSFSLDVLEIKIFEKFVCELYGEKCEKVNEARYRLFCLKTSSEQSLPPTKDALDLHIKRANYQAAVYRLALFKRMDLPSPSLHGWNILEGDISIQWMELDPAPENILKYIHCNCKKSCDNKRCSCKMADVSCTDLCGCQSCENRTITCSENSELEQQDSDLEDDID